MARKCPYLRRNCAVMFPSGIDLFPSPDQLRQIRPVLGTLADLAKAYDDAAVDGELTTAQEFLLWLQVDVEHATLWGAASPVIAEPAVKRQVEYRARQRGAA